VELFFFFTVIHLWGKYWMAAWRGGRARVWMTGAVAFVVAVPCALTGYVSQQNFDAQWIATQAKDGLNAAGVGSFFNVLNFGQMYSYHVFLLPLAVVALVIAHVLLVRRHGIVPPFPMSKAAVATDSIGEPSPVPVPAPPSAPAAEDRSEPMAARDAPPGELAP
jgi:quinol-cytochrome oxidoreductase complex cytochrome b subunit